MAEKLKICIDKSPVLDNPRLLFAAYNAYKERKSNIKTSMLSTYAQQRLTEAVTTKNVGLLTATDTVIASSLNEAAMDRGRKWEVGRNLKIRFLDGSPALHHWVIQSAQEWMRFANINFDFTQSGEAEVRIGFAQGDGSWSYIGTDCLSITDQSERTMNLDGYGHILSPSFAATILHEFGHTLGLIHEHQSPAAGIPWNEPVVYDYYDKVQHWSKDKIDHNLFARYGPDARISNTGYDKNSIMHYPIPVEHVLDASFASGWNYNLSMDDRAFIASQYPR